MPSAECRVLLILQSREKKGQTIEGGAERNHAGCILELAAKDSNQSRKQESKSMIHSLNCAPSSRLILQSNNKQSLENAG
jgi:hypothetical protein